MLLDEIAEIPLETQAELLRVLQERRFRAVGEEKESRKLTARVLCATHRDMALLMHEGRVREDFYRRVRMLKLTVPSLRSGSTPCRRALRPRGVHRGGPLRPRGRGDPRGPGGDRGAHELRRHPWTGNMRELAQCVAEVQTTGTYVPERPDPAVALAIALRNVRVPLNDVRRRYAEIAVEKAGNPTAAARLLGVDTRTLNALLKDEPEPTLLRAPPSKRAPSSKRQGWGGYHTVKHTGARELLAGSTARPPRGEAPRTAEADDRR